MNINRYDIVGLCGSLRSGSLNRMALKLASDLMPEGLRIDVAEWRGTPIYDANLQAQGFPSEVTALADRLRRADGVVIATPEYNFSIPGGLKNVLDWVSRVDRQPFANKPVAILSASPGPVGGARVQYDLRKVMLFLNAMPLVKPEVFIANAAGKFDADGHCTDDPTRKFVGDQMKAFERWIAAVQRMHAA